MPPHVPKTYTLEEATVNGVYDSYRMQELEGKKLIDLLSKVRLGRVRTTKDEKILNSWCRDYRAKGVPYVVAWRDGNRREVSLFNEVVVLTEKELEVIEAFSD